MIEEFEFISDVGIIQKVSIQNRKENHSIVFLLVINIAQNEKTGSRGSIFNKFLQTVSNKESRNPNQCHTGII